MSTQLRNVPNTNVIQTRFFGGEDRGTCVQLTRRSRSSDPSNMFDMMQFTREEALSVATELLMFAQGFEVEED
jgi:hypothetical protein